MAVNLSLLAGAGWQFSDDNGDPLSGGKLNTYAAGTTAPQATYTSSSGATPNANPIILNAAGRLSGSGEIWLTEGVLYKFVLTDANNVLIGTYDNISGANDGTAIYAALANTADPAKGDALVGFRQSNTSGNLTGSVGRTVHQKLQEVVSVKDFGAVGDGAANDTAAFQAAATIGGQILVPRGTYRIVGEVIFGSNTTLNVDAGTVFTMDCSGENGRGFYFREAINSGVVGSFTINASATSVSSTDGARNTCIQFGNDTADAAPTITRFCFVYGSVEINISGVNNVKGIYLNGWVEDTVIENVAVTGTTNFALVAHWSSDNFPALPTKTWHPHNITFRNCKVYQKAGFSKPLRGFTLSGGGRATLQGCYADTTTLGYNLFVGDYGYTYAQNISAVEAMSYVVVDCYNTGAGGFSADAISTGLNGSPVWNGFQNNATVQVTDFEADANAHATGLAMAFTGLKKGIFSGIDLYSDNVTHTREFFYPQLCGEIQVTNSVFKHHEYMRLRTTDYVLVDGCSISKPAPTPDVTSYAITIEGVDFANITNSTIKDARFGIYSADNFDKAIRVVGNTFQQIGAACVDVGYTSQLTVSNNTFKTVGTTTTSTNISCIALDPNVTGFTITGNLFSTNEYRYLINLSSTAANGVITGNAFLDLNTSALNAAAVLKNVAATNIKLDPDNNVVGPGIALVFP